MNNKRIRTKESLKMLTNQSINCQLAHNLNSFWLNNSSKKKNIIQFESNKLNQLKSQQ